MKLNRENFFAFLISWLIYHLQISCVLSHSQRNCSLLDPECNDHETCTEVENSKSEGHCVCKRNYIFQNNRCVLNPESIEELTPTSSSAIVSPDPHSTGGASGTLWVLIPCLLLGAAGALILVSRRYKLLERLYSLRLRRYNTVFVSSLNDDDAPIT
ncbi:uncharacterized protein [Rhodnius prolixus]|uniref:Uncharacterized protein n=1 Tax=Rhodnius prolixus TaxID=13249 RepID=T1HP44_RHOPR